MAETQTLKATIRDFIVLQSTVNRLRRQDSTFRVQQHPDFQKFGGGVVEKNIVQARLGADGKPQFGSPAFAGTDKETVTNATSFRSWYNDDPDFNQSDEYEIELTEVPAYGYELRRVNQLPDSGRQLMALAASGGGHLVRLFDPDGNKVIDQVTLPGSLVQGILADLDAKVQERSQSQNQQQNKELDIEIQDLEYGLIARTAALLGQPLPPSEFFIFNSRSFFPIDDSLFGKEGFKDNDGTEHNFHFTLELQPHMFTYRGDEQFTFSGDDDLWVFIDNQLVIDLGGTHFRESETIDLSLAPGQTVFEKVMPTGQTLRLEKGKSYSFGLFFAERHTASSHFRIETSFRLKPVQASIVASIPDAAEPGNGQIKKDGEFTITLNEPALEDLTIAYDISGTADNGVDYEPLPQFVTIKQGETVAKLPVVPLGDTDTNEGPETVTVTLKAGPKYELDPLPENATATVTIEDAPPLPIVSIMAAPPTALEPFRGESGKNGGFIISLNQPAQSDLTINCRDQGGTATSGQDYTPLGQQVVIRAGETQVAFPVIPLEDRVSDPDETVVVTLEPGDGYELHSNPTKTKAVVLIKDVYFVFAGVVASRATAVEPHLGQSGIDGEFMISLTDPALVDTTIQYRIRGSATSDTDFEPLPTSVTIKKGETFVKIPVVPKEDQAQEPDETVVLILNPGTGYRLDEAIAPLSATVKIVDTYKEPVVKLLTPDPDAAEFPRDQGLFKVVMDRVLFQDVAVKFTIGGTATLNRDYESAPLDIQMVTIPAGETQVFMPVLPIFDEEQEGTETVMVTLEADPLYKLGTPIKGTVNIADYIVPTVSVEASIPTAREAGNGQTQVNGEFTVSLNKPALRDLPLAVTVGGTALPNIDYGALSRIIVIPKGTTQVKLPVIPKTDDLQEGNETVMLSLNDGKGYLVNPAKRKATVTIIDAPPPLLVSIETTKSPAQEPFATRPAVKGEFTVSLDRPAWTELTINCRDGGGRAQSGLDYLALPQQVTIPKGTTSHKIAVVPRADRLLEGNEAVVMNLEPGTNYEVDATKQRAVVVIRDFIPPIAGVTAPQPRAKEPSRGVPATNGVFRFYLNAPAVVDTVIRYKVLGSATPGADYVPLPNAVIIPKGNTAVTRQVVPKADALKEQVESVVVVLEQAQNYRLVASQHPTRAVVGIHDMTPPTASIVANRPNAKEPGKDQARIDGEFTIRLSHPNMLGRPTTVKYRIDPASSARQGVDYRPLRTAVIPAGQTVVKLPVVPLQDDTTEPPETVIVNLAPGVDYELDPKVARRTATVTIRDTPPPPPLLVATIRSKPGVAHEPREAGDEAVSRKQGRFFIELSEPAPKTLRIKYDLKGDAKRGKGKDYLLKDNDGRVVRKTEAVFRQGDRRVILHVVPLGDRQYNEDDEDVIAVLKSGDDYQLNRKKKATVVIKPYNTEPGVIGGDRRNRR